MSERVAGPVAAVKRAFAAINDPAIFISLKDEGVALAEAAALEAAGPDGQAALWAGLCGQGQHRRRRARDHCGVSGVRLSRRPRRRWLSRRLEAAGAIVIGKTNLDQFATGLVGVRSPYGVPRNVLDPELIPGGSSSGSAVAVAAGIVDFSLGTDTAGSGRIPAGMNGIVGLKPSLGLLSSTGMVPACRTLDTISVFARSVALAVEVTAVAAGYDAADAYSRKLPVPVLGAAPPKLRVGVSPPEQRKFFGDEAARVAYEADLERAGGDGRRARRARFRAAARGGAAAL